MKWKPIWRLTMIGAAVALSAGIAAGGVGDLQYVKSPRGSGGMCQPRQPVNAVVRKVTGLHSPKAVLLSDKGPVCVILDAARAGGAELTDVRVDAAAAGDFSQAVTIKCRMRGTTGSFGPETIEVQRDGKAIPVVVSGHYHTGDSVQGGAGVTAAAEGECAFGKTTRKIRIVDGTSNLSLSDAATPPFSDVGARPKGDGILVADAEGNFASSNPTSFVGQPVQVDGAWYVVSVDGLKASAARIKGKGGKISVDGAQWTCTLASEKYFLTVTGGADPVAVPAGSYRVLSYRLTMAAAGSRGPSISGSAGTKPVEVKAGKSTKLPLGSPITAKVIARKSGENVSFSLAQTDPVGATIGSVLAAGGKRPPKPSIEVVGADGAVVYTASLEYG